MKNTKLIYLQNCLIACGLILTGVCLQYLDGLIPCPLCLLQRATFILLALLFMLGFLLYRYKALTFFINLVTLASALIGIGLAGRQVWIQHFPSEQAMGCSASLSYMMQVLPFTELLQVLFQGSAECSEKGWSFLHLGLAEWALMWFIFFFAISCYLLIKTSRRYLNP